MNNLKENNIITNEKQQIRSEAIALRRDSDAVLERTQHWAPSVPPWQPLKKSPNSSLRMACIVEDRLYQGLRFEGEFILLTPYNWKHVLSHGKPDVLLMESIWNTATGHWHMGQCLPSPHRTELLEIVALANRLSIPAVFWITKGREYHKHYKDFARHFDAVFCADPREVDLLQVEGIDAEILLPCAQPAVYNPFRHYENYNTLNLDILYDGWADLDRMTDELRVLKEVTGYGLNIIESRYQIFRRRMDVLPDYKDHILGCVSGQSRILALKYAKAYITLDKTISTKTTQQWMSLEAAASRLPVVHHGSLAANDVRKGLVVECPEQMEALVELVRLHEDEMYRERVAHLGWRKTNREHTFAHRVRAICQRIGIDHDFTEYPKVSLITPTFRRELILNSVKSYEQQIYPNKELIMVFNGHEVPSYHELGMEETRNDLRITGIPRELFAGTCLNLGHLQAEGEYCFRLDDDDYYGPNYILDMILEARCIDADLFGKPPSPLVFENDETVYVRRTALPFSIITERILKDKKQWIGGNSIAGRTSFLRNYNYNDYSFGAADTSFLCNITDESKSIFAVMDNFNLVAKRRNNQSTHTWKEASERIKNKSTNFFADVDLIL
jgi:hypothetical protein